MALTVAVTPAHIYMLQQPELFGLPIWALWVRLPVQVPTETCRLIGREG